MFGVQVPLPSDVRETDFFRFVARNLKGAKDVEIEHASYTLRVGYVFFSSRKECESAAEVFERNELNGVALETFVIQPESDTTGVLVERKQPEENEDTAKKHTRHKHRHRHRSSSKQSERGKSDGAESGRHKSRHRHRHHHRRRRDSYSDESSYSSESSASSYSSSDETDSSRNSGRHRHKHRHRSRSSTPAK